MGGEPPKKKQPEMTMDDAILDMRMFEKQLKSQSAKAKKEAEAMVKKAKNCLKNGDEEGASMFMNTALTKNKEADDNMKMANKMAHMTMVMRNNTNQEKMLQHYQKVTPIIQKQAANLDLAKMSDTLDAFTSSMDNIQVNAKTMDTLIMGDTAKTDDVSDGLKQLKRELQLQHDLQEQKNYKEKISSDKFKNIDSI